MTEGLSLYNRFIKRLFDLVVACIGLILTGWLIFFSWLLVTLSMGRNGFFLQPRVGRGGRLFKVIKIRTMRDIPALKSTISATGDPRITRLGNFMRKSKIDELPQLINIVMGDMSFVGPRPDVPGYADRLDGGDRIILSIRPGITGPATLKYRNEEDIFAAVDDPEKHNREVVWPDKVRLNRQYIENYSFWGDIRYILQTVLGRG